MSRAVYLARVLRHTARRLRARRALLALGYTGATAALLCVAAGWWLPAIAVWCGWVGLCVLAMLGGALRPVVLVNVARALDQSHALPDTLQTALQFAHAQPDRAGFRALLAREAERVAQRVSPARAVALPTRLPAVSVALGAAMLLASAWTRPRDAQEAVRPKPRTGAQSLPDSARSKSEPIARAEQVIQAIAQGRLTHAEAIEALVEAEQALGAAPKGSMPSALLAQLSTLFEARGEARVRSLARIAKDPAQEAAQQRADAEQIAAKRRELEALRVQHAKHEAAQRTLSELDKRMTQAQQALQRNAPGEASEQLAEAERQLETQKQQERASAKRQSMGQQLAQLRELLERRAGAAQSESKAEAQRRRESERRFSERAGGKTQQGVAAQPDAHGEGAPNNGGEGGGDQPSGDDGEPDLFARGQRPRVSLDDHVASSQQAEGDSRSEVIATSADRGFATAPYQRVYADYRQHAEELLAQDEIPAAYRFYVRRYFQLIKPRPTGETRRPTATGGKP